jgi:hypothetical protein
MSKVRLALFVLVAALAISLPLATASAAGRPAPKLGASASSGCFPDGPVNIRATFTPSGPAAKITSGTATVHWSVGDQVYTLTRDPGSAGNAVKVLAAVPAGQGLGVVSIDVQVFVGVAEFDKTISAKVVCGSTGGVG